MAVGTTVQEGIRMTRIRIMCDQTDGTTIKLGTITLALLRWIGHLEQFSQITNQQDKDDA